MSTSIDKVPGIGPATAVLLADHGIFSAEDLAAKRVGDLAAIKGFNTIRSGQVIEAARLLTGATAEDSPVPPGKSSKKDKDKKVEKKKKKSKEQTKKLKKSEKKKSTKARKKSSAKKSKEKKK
jgi:transcription termination factor NusA